MGEHSSLAAIQSKTSSICSIEVNHLQAKLIRMMKSVALVYLLLGAVLINDVEGHKKNKKNKFHGYGGSYGQSYAPSYHTPSYSAPAYSAPAYSAPAYSAPSYTPSYS